MKKNEFDDIVKNDMMLNDRRIDDGGYGGFALSPNYIGENKVIELDDVVLNKITNELNVDNLKYLKSGEYGDAYNIGNDKILKLTTDRSEALESQKIRGKFNKHLADIYNVYEINYTIAGNNKKIYVILLEFLDVNKDRFTDYIKNINEYFRDKTDTIILDIVDDYHFNRNVYNNEYKEHVQEFLKLRNEESRFLEDFLNIIDELKTNNMKTADYVNMGNLGYKKNGKLGYFDFGYGNENGEIKNIININENKFSLGGDNIDSKQLDEKIKHIHSLLKQELDKYNDENLDDRWTDIRQYIRTIDNYFKDGYFVGNRKDLENQMNEFLSGFNYSNSDTYKKGEKTHILPNSNSGYDDKYEIPVYKAIGNNTLFRGVSLDDWERIKKQGYIDSDMRGAILDTEGINLAQTPTTAFNYLPVNNEGVIMAISPNDLDLYMLKDGYIRVFETIPIKNIIKVSNIFLKNDIGTFLTTNTNQKINDIIDKLKNIGVDNIININERKLSYMDGSQTVQVKDKCKLGGLGNTSAACNQGDISNITLTNLKEESENIEGYSGCLMLNLNIPKWNKIISRVNKNEIYIKPYDDSYGLEENPHVTIKYGINDNVNPEDVFEFINKHIDGEVKLQLTGIGIFQNEDFDVIKFNVESEELRKLNELINNKFDYRDTYSDYKPHITIAYLNSGTGEKYVREFDKPINISGSNLRYSNQNDEIDETYDVLNNLNDLQDSKNKPIFVEENKILTEDTMTLNELPFIEDIKSIGGDIYAVGGIVRDELLGKESKDLDILITGVPMDKIEQIASKYGKVDAVGKQFGVLKFKPHGYDGEDIDIAIPRTEKSTGEGGHKGFDVVSDHNLSIEDDLLRRDFKLNALAKDLNGKIIDPYGGLQDIKDKKISMVNPEAFSDDPLRMLRAIQFASRFGFDIDSDTMENIRKNAHKIEEIPSERLLIEFDKIIKKGDIQKGVFLLKQTRLLKNIVGSDNGILISNKWDDVTNMGEFIYLLTENLVDKPSEFYKNNLKGDIENIDIIKALELAYNDYSDNKIENRVLIFNMNKISPKVMDSKILPDVLYNLISEFKQNRYPLTNKDLKVDGNDLKSLGLNGREIGDMLRKILINIYADKLKNSKENIINFVKTNKNE